MKIRNGFVSNSSSSSFIVIFDKKPESVEEVRSLLYGKSKAVINYDEKMSTLVLAEIVFEDIENPEKCIKCGDKKSIDKLVEEFEDIFWSPEYYTIPEEFTPDKKDMDELATLSKDKYSDERWKDISKISKKLAKIEAKKYLEIYKDKFILITNYSDNDGSIQSELEHGDTFRNLIHIQISHH